MSLTRRQLLASATALSGVAILPPEGHRLVSEERDLAAAQTQKRNPNYVDGVVVWARPGMAHVKDRWFQGPRAERRIAPLRIVPGTDICRGPCGWHPELIRVGDRVEAWTTPLEDGTHTAPWVLVNVAAFWGEVLEVAANHLVVRGRNHTCSQRVNVEPDTIVRTVRGRLSGSTGHFAVGEYVQVAGGALEPNSDAVIVATSIVKVYQKNAA
jgi:uncharacterized protein DUF5666